MLKKPLISIVVPAYRCEPFIKDCIKSLLNQTIRDTEIIIVNDNSPDNLEETVKRSFKQEIKSGKIVYLKNKTNKGPSFSRNRGASVARSEYLLFADADDVYLENYAETLYKTLISGNYDMVQVFSKIYIDENGKLLIHRRYPLLGRAWFILYMFNFQIAYILVKKQSFIKLGGFSEKWTIGEDWHILTKCLREGFRLKLIDKPITLHREHALSTQAIQQREKGFDWLKYKNQKVLPYLKKLHSFGKVKMCEIATFVFGMIFITSIWQWPNLFIRILKTDPLFFIKCPESLYYTLLAIYKIIRWKIRGI